MEKIVNKYNAVNFEFFLTKKTSTPPITDDFFFFFKKKERGKNLEQNIGKISIKKNLQKVQIALRKQNKINFSKKNWF